MNRKFMICAVNAENGYEQSRITPAVVKKNVVVIGAGVAGLEAARVAAKKGHHVTLFKKRKNTWWPNKYSRCTASKNRIR